MFTRRTLLGRLGLVAALPTLPRLVGPWRSAQRALVVIQLTGGNDGLGTVVPWRQDAYGRARPTLAYRPERLHRLDDEHGLHPEAASLAALFERGRLTIVQGVGFQGAGRSHFQSLAVWHSGRLTPAGRRTEPVGWLGRMADRLALEDPGAIPALHVGADAPSPALRGERSTPTGLESLADLELRAPRGLSMEDLRPGTEEPAGTDEAYVLDVARNAHRAMARLGDLTPRRRGAYPDESFAQGLRLVAELIEEGPGTRLFSLSLGGFDTHARQAPTHAALLAKLSGALAAFERDLSERGLAERVATLVFSEFGRRVEENGSRGTDHGAAAPALLLGGPGRGGLVGSAPDLDRLVDGDLPAGVDFRSLYAALEGDWMGLDPSGDVAPFDFS